MANASGRTGGGLLQQGSATTNARSLDRCRLRDAGLPIDWRGGVEMGAGKVSGQPGDMPRGLYVCEARSLSPQSVGARSPNEAAAGCQQQHGVSSRAFQPAASFS